MDVFCSIDVYVGNEAMVGGSEQDRDPLVEISNSRYDSLFIESDLKCHIFLLMR